VTANYGSATKALWYAQIPYNPYNFVENLTIVSSSMTIDSFNCASQTQEYHTAFFFTFMFTFDSSSYSLQGFEEYSDANQPGHIEHNDGKPMNCHYGSSCNYEMAGDGWNGGYEFTVTVLGSP